MWYRLKIFIEYVSDNLLLVAYEEDKRVSLRESILNFKNTDKKDIYILIGSEGGFEEEIEWLVERGAVSVGLGREYWERKLRYNCILFNTWIYVGLWIKLLF